MTASEDAGLGGGGIPSSAPVELPRSPRLFWSARPEFAELKAPQGPAEPSALERLGPPPFAKSGFPFIGFLATIYDHVATHAGPRNCP